MNFQERRERERRAEALKGWIALGRAAERRKAARINNWFARFEAARQQAGFVMGE